MYRLPSHTRIHMLHPILYYIYTYTYANLPREAILDFFCFIRWGHSQWLRTINDTHLDPVNIHGLPRKIININLDDEKNSSSGIF